MGRRGGARKEPIQPQVVAQKTMEVIRRSGGAKEAIDALDKLWSEKENWPPLSNNLGELRTPTYSAGAVTILRGSEITKIGEGTSTEVLHPVVTNQQGAAKMNVTKPEAASLGAQRRLNLAKPVETATNVEMTVAANGTHH